MNTLGRDIASPVAQPQVSYSLENLGQTVERLDGLVQSLIQRLAPVLRPSAPTPGVAGGPKQVMESRAALAEIIDDAQARTSSSADHIEGILVRLEI